MIVPRDPIALMVVSVWIRLGATVVAACLALPGRGVRETSTSACPTPAALRAAWTASSSPMTTSASAAAPSLVRASPDCLPAQLGAGVGARHEETGP